MPFWTQAPLFISSTTSAGLRSTAQHLQTTLLLQENAVSQCADTAMWTSIHKDPRARGSFDCTMWLSVKTSPATWCLSDNCRSVAIGGTHAQKTIVSEEQIIRSFAHSSIATTNLSLKISPWKCQEAFSWPVEEGTTRELAGRHQRWTHDYGIFDLAIPDRGHWSIW